MKIKKVSRVKNNSFFEKWVLDFFIISKGALKKQGNPDVKLYSFHCNQKQILYSLFGTI